MVYKVAVSSTDGKVVNQHFGHTERFCIFEIADDGKYEFLELRSVQACCHQGEHETDAFSAVLNKLRDVQAVIVSKIGRGAADFLESNGITVYEAPYPIEPLLEKITQEKLYEVDKWQLHINN